MQRRSSLLLQPSSMTAVRLKKPALLQGHTRTHRYEQGTALRSQR
jgi:hypothetical protein